MTRKGILTLLPANQRQGKHFMTLRRSFGKRRGKQAAHKAKYLDQSITWFGWILMELLIQICKRVKKILDLRKRYFWPFYNEIYKNVRENPLFKQLALCAETLSLEIGSPQLTLATLCLVSQELTIALVQGLIASPWSGLPWTARKSSDMEKNRPNKVGDYIVEKGWPG